VFEEIAINTRFSASRASQSHVPLSLGGHHVLLRPTSLTDYDVSHKGYCLLGTSD
jgi:hypothetical protein